MRTKTFYTFVASALFGIVSAPVFAGEISESSEASLAIGLMHRNGIHCTKDLAHAEQCFLLSASKGNSIAQYELALISVGRVKSPNDEDAKAGMKWLTLSAESGCAEAQYELGMFFAAGVLTEPDFAKSIELFKKAEEGGSTNALYGTALAYETGSGVTRSAENAAFYYLSAANRGLPLAQFKIGTKYLIGDGVTANNTLALEWLEKAAKNGCAYAAFNLGIIYRDGNGVKKNLNRSVYHISLAANKGIAAAERELGLMYQKGLGVNKDEEEALIWMNRAAMHGNATALISIALSYIDKPNRASSEIKAYAYARAAEKRGFKNKLWVNIKNRISTEELSKAVAEESVLESHIEDFQNKFIEL